MIHFEIVKVEFSFSHWWEFNYGQCIWDKCGGIRNKLRNALYKINFCTRFHLFLLKPYPLNLPLIFCPQYPPKRSSPNAFIPSLGQNQRDNEQSKNIIYPINQKMVKRQIMCDKTLTWMCNRLKLKMIIEKGAMSSTKRKWSKIKTMWPKFQKSKHEK